MTDHTNEPTGAAPRDAAAAAMDSVRRLVRALRTASAASERDHDVSAAQLFVLRQVAARPGLSMRELGERTLTSQSAVSEVVARLVRRGLITRLTASDDHRRAELGLTPAGERALGRAPETLQERMVAGFRRLPVEQQAAIAGGLEAWLAASGLTEVPATMFFEPTES